MKKTISVLCVTAILLATIIWAQIYVETTLNYTLKQIEVLSQNISNTNLIATENILNFAKNLDDYWTEKERVLCLVINHNDLNRIGEQIKKVVIYIEQNDKDNCEYELITLKFYAESYQHVMDIKFENLL